MIASRSIGPGRRDRHRVDEARPPEHRILGRRVDTRRSRGDHRAVGVDRRDLPRRTVRRLEAHAGSAEASPRARVCGLDQRGQRFVRTLPGERLALDRCRRERVDLCQILRAQLLARDGRGELRAGVAHLGQGVDVEVGLDERQRAARSRRGGAAQAVAALDPVPRAGRRDLIGARVAERGVGVARAADGAGSGAGLGGDERRREHRCEPLPRTI